MKRHIFIFFILLCSVTAYLSAQVVDNQLGRTLKSIFPELEQGYIDLNGNGQKDRTVELDETIPDSKVKDSIIQVQEILDFLIDNFRFIPLEQFSEVKQSLENASDTIPEIISLTYIDRVERTIDRKRELGETGIYLTPSARRDALEKMRNLIATMVHAYKKEGNQYEQDFVQARDELFSMIEKGYPFPENLNEEDASVLENSMINTIVKNEGTNQQRVKTAVKTLGKLESQSSVPYLIELLKEDAYKVPVIQALGDIGTQQALDLLSEEMGKTTSAREKTVIISALGQIGGEQGVERIVSLFPQSEEESISEEIERPALQALLSLAENGNTDGRIFNIFKRYLDSDNPELRIIAVKGLAYFPRTNAGELLISLLKEEKNEKVLTWAVRSLNTVGHSATLTTFITMLRDEEISDGIKAEVVRALGENRQGPKALQYITAHLGSDNEKLRNAVSETLIKLYEVDQRTVAGYLSRGMRTSDDETYLTAGSAVLASIADENTVATLLTLMQKPYPEMKKNVTWALYRIRTGANARIVGELAKLVTSETEPLTVRTNSVRAIGAMGYDTAQLNVWQTLVTTAKMRGEKYALLKLFAVRALGSLNQKNEEVISTLTGIATREQDMELKKEAVKSIRRLAVMDKPTADSLANLYRRNDDTELKVLILETLGDMRSEKTSELASSLLLGPDSPSDLAVEKKRRIIYALSKSGSEDDLSLIIDAASETELREFIRAVLEDADTTVMKPLIERRLQTESDTEIQGLLEALQAVYDARF